jgi:hypothetical protein
MQNANNMENVFDRMGLHDVVAPETGWSCCRMTDIAVPYLNFSPVLLLFMRSHYDMFPYASV